MADDSLIIRTSQVLGITASGAIAGGIFNFSAVLIPTLTLPSSTDRREVQSSLKMGAPVSHIVSQWNHAYSMGKSFMPVASLITASAYSYLSYHFRHGTLTQQGNIVAANYYLFAALLTVAPIPFTLLVMAPTNSKLIAKAESAEKESVLAQKEGDVQSELAASREESEVKGWLKTWTAMNTIRGLFPFLGTVCAVVATIS